MAAWCAGKGKREVIEANAEEGRCRKRTLEPRSRKRWKGPRGGVKLIQRTALHEGLQLAASSDTGASELIYGIV